MRNETKLLVTDLVGEMWQDIRKRVGRQDDTRITWGLWRGMKKKKGYSGVPI